VGETLADGYELDDDPARVDLDTLHRFLSEDAWWALGRPRETVERHLHEAAVIAGLYAPSGDQVGYCRVVSDLTVIAYLADVWVEPAHRGHGRGVALVGFAVDHPRLADVRTMLLHTRDSHTLYERHGFARPLDDERLMHRKSPLA
jgi:GNAT superfamily N-acetyltransferase